MHCSHKRGIWSEVFTLTLFKREKLNYSSVPQPKSLQFKLEFNIESLFCRSSNLIVTQLKVLCYESYEIYSRCYHIPGVEIHKITFEFLYKLPTSGQAFPNKKPYNWLSNCSCSWVKSYYNVCIFFFPENTNQSNKKLIFKNISSLHVSFYFFIEISTPLNPFQQGWPKCRWVCAYVRLFFSAQTNKKYFHDICMLGLLTLIVHKPTGSH